MVDKVFEQSLYRVKKKEILEESQLINKNLSFIVKSFKDVGSLLAELWLVASYDESASLLHKSFMESDDTILIYRCLAVLTYLENPYDSYIIENLVEEIQKVKERNKLSNIKDNSDKLNQVIEDNFYTREYKEKRDNVKSKIDIAKLYFYSYLKDNMDFHEKFKELGQMASSLNFGNEFNRTVINNYETINTRRILSLLLFASQPNEGNIDFVLDVIRTMTPDKYENIYKKIK